MNPPIKGVYVWPILVLSVKFITMVIRNKAIEAKSTAKRVVFA